MLCYVPFCLLCGLTMYTVFGTVFSPALTVGMLAIGPRDSQALFSPSHCCRSTEARSQFYSSLAPGPTVGAMEAAQTLVWPNPHMYVHTEPIVAKAGPVPAARALVVLSDVSQALNLESHQ